MHYGDFPNIAVVVIAVKPTNFTISLIKGYNIEGKCITFIHLHKGGMSEGYRGRG